MQRESMNRTVNPSLFQKNLEALRSLNPEQAEMIVQAAPRVQPRLYTSEVRPDESVLLYLPDATGVPQPLTVADDPERERETWLRQINTESDDAYAVILVGFGMGDYAIHLLPRLPENAILAVVESDAMLFFSAFFSVDLSPLLTDKRVHLYIGQKFDKAVESIGRELQWGRFLANPYQIAIHPYVRRHRPDSVPLFSQLWRDALQRELMYRRARAEHGATVVMNTVTNFPTILRSPGVSSLYYNFYKTPAILVGAGPSAEKSLPILSDNSHRFLIACVNTAYPVLRKYGIEPHIVFAMDHQERNTLSFQEYKPSENAFLVADPRIHPAIFAAFAQRSFIASWKTTTETLGNPAPVDRVPVPKRSGNALFQWMQNYTGPKGDVFGPGSVAVAGFHILARMGCQPIILTGLDLAFTGNQTYVPGTIFDDKNLPRDTQAAHYVRGNEGEILGTSDTLYLYRQLLEHEIARFGVPVFNTGAGAVIRGTITSRVENLLYDIPRITGNPADAFRMLSQSYAPTYSLHKIGRHIEEAITHLKTFSSEAKQGLYRLPEAPDSLNTDQRNSLLAHLEATVAACSKNHETAMELLNELLQEIHFEFEENRWRHHLRQDQDTLLNEKITLHSRVLDTFIKQAEFLISLLEEAKDGLR